MATIGSLEAFNNDNETWTEYVERMGHFFDANEITDTKKQKAILLSSVGAKTYKLIKTLLAPVKPGEKTFAELVKLVQEHECPKPSPIVQRFKFNSRKQVEGEAVSEYVADLRRIAEFCDYGDKLEEMLRDRIVCGIGDIRTQRRLLSQADLDFKTALKTAQAMETAAKHSQDLQQAVKTNVGENVNKLAPAPRNFKKPYNFNELRGRCYRCGAREHRAHECKHSETVCYNCNMKGHMSSVCQKPRQQGKSGNQSNSWEMKQSNKPGHRTNELGADNPQETESHESGTLENMSVQYDLYQINKQTVEPWRTQVLVEGQEITMEIDTGAAVTIMSKADFNKYWPDGNLVLQDTNAFLRTYTGERVEVYGQCDVRVKGREKEAVLPLLVIPGKHATLLGRNWLSHIPIDWGPLKEVIYGSAGDAMGKHPEVFAEGLGQIKGFKAKIYLKEETTPRFLRRDLYLFQSKIGLRKS